MGQRIELTFCLPDGSEKYPIEWVIREIPLADRWFANMARALQSDNKTMQQDFFGWNHSSEDFASVVQKINESISVINSYYNKRYQICELASVDMDQAALNILHHHFELLMGQNWNVSPLVKNVPDFVLQAVVQLNEKVHAFESMQRSRAAISNNEEVIRGFRCSLRPNDFLVLEPNDFSHFTCMYEPGDLATDYCQLGKSWSDAYFDADEAIHPENISALRYYSSSFNCHMDLNRAEDAKLFAQKVRKFIQNKSDKFHMSIDPEDPKNAIGQAIYANPVKGSAFLQWKYTEQVSFFSRHQKIGKIRLKAGSTCVSRDFPI